MLSMNFWFFAMVLTIIGGSFGIGWYTCKEEQSSDEKFYKDRYDHLLEENTDLKADIRELRRRNERLEERLSIRED